jgi:site-specific DNA recombinase
LTAPVPFPPSTRLVAYLRDSGGDRQDTSIAQQEQAIGAWCREHEYLLTRVFRDVARSGTSLTGRDQFLAMVNYLDDGAAEKGVLLYELARFSRQFDDTLYYLADLRRRGYVVHSITDPVPDTLDGRLIESITAWKNAKYSDDLRRLVKRGLSYVVTQHHAALGSAPVGYKSVPVEIGTRRDGTPHVIAQLEPDEHTAPLVRQAFEMRATGATTSEIHAVVHLHARLGAYYRMFRNPIYIGMRGEIKDFCIPLEGLSIWDAVQTLGAERAARYGYNHPRAVRSRFFLTGLLKCGMCGSPMNGRVLKRKPYPDILYYRCIGCIRTENQCHASVIPKTLLERRVVQVVRERILIPEVLSGAYARAQRIVANGDSDRLAAIQRAQDELATNTQAVGRIVAAIRDMGHSGALLVSLEALETEGRELSERLAKLEAAAPRVLPDMDMAQVARAISDRLVSAPPEELGQVLRSFIDSITASKPQRKELAGSITYRLPVEGVFDTFAVSL